MAEKKAPPKRDWTQAQPHDPDTGLIVTRKYAEKHPEKVTWVRGKNEK
ncbi:MAG TPA: hypothetical protein VGS07_13240 [Thermoanaerobaculia bacterium]|jgi:hypothetical protein|nr:hypothetical protein [Thermoanaerobaculia bacterium]